MLMSLSVSEVDVLEREAEIEGANLNDDFLEVISLLP
jgi:hypothetical protein